MYNVIIYNHYVRKISRQNPGVVSKHKPLAALKGHPEKNPSKSLAHHHLKIGNSEKL